MGRTGVGRRHRAWSAGCFRRCRRAGRPGRCRTGHRELRRKSVTLSLLSGEYKGTIARGWSTVWFCEEVRGLGAEVRPGDAPVAPRGREAVRPLGRATVPVVDRVTGEVRQAQSFVGVLGASSYTYGEARWTQTRAWASATAAAAWRRSPRVPSLSADSASAASNRSSGRDSVGLGSEELAGLAVEGVGDPGFAADAGHHPPVLGRLRAGLIQPAASGGRGRPRCRRAGA